MRHGCDTELLPAIWISTAMRHGPLDARIGARTTGP
jgi:hypothetical protein